MYVCMFVALHLFNTFLILQVIAASVPITLGVGWYTLLRRHRWRVVLMRVGKYVSVCVCVRVV